MQAELIPELMDPFVIQSKQCVVGRSLRVYICNILRKMSVNRFYFELFY